MPWNTNTTTQVPTLPPRIPSHRPYWKRAHSDWRLWVLVLLMMAAMMTYVMTNDFVLPCA